MQTVLNKQEIEKFRQKIESAPPEARDALQAQLDDLLNTLDKKAGLAATSSDELDSDDTKVEALFDNMPV